METPLRPVLVAALELVLVAQAADQAAPVAVVVAVVVVAPRVPVAGPLVVPVVAVVVVHGGRVARLAGLVRLRQWLSATASAAPLAG